MISTWAMAFHASNVVIVGLAPISAVLIEIYPNVTTFHTTYCVLVASILYIPANFPANFLFDKYGIMIPQWVASVCYVIGAWVRLLAGSDPNKFYWILIGQTIAGLGQCFQI